MNLTKEQTIDKLGLRGKQGKIYLYLLEQGPSVVADIAHDNSLGRTSVYLLLDHLLKQNLVNQVIRGKTKYYKAISINELIELKKEKIEELERIRPILEDLSKVERNKPKVEFFEGEEGVKKIYNNTLSAKTSITGCVSVDVIKPYLWETFGKNYIQKRVAKKIPAWGFVPNSEGAEEYRKNDRREMRVTKVLDPKKYPLTNEINIYDDKVAVMSFKPGEYYGFTIQSKEFAKTLRSIFQLAWDNYKGK